MYSTKTSGKPEYFLPDKKRQRKNKHCSGISGIDLDLIFNHNSDHRQKQVTLPMIAVV